MFYRYLKLDQLVFYFLKSGIVLPLYVALYLKQNNGYDIFSCCILFLLCVKFQLPSQVQGTTYDFFLFIVILHHGQFDHVLLLEFHGIDEANDIAIGRRGGRGIQY
ncbi:hypothetical protein BST97_09620 [Nonlabens spongiae]|uniref:Uncharacterized protein n=1 Tax=Nonlabens spongiae TaxID=331648 RepID=A0A1W6MKT8_9FLAO|nr:hypothetical protein BST97_09620 [Nonlabens spongiae]